jgi:TIR domain-containing protein
MSTVFVSYAREDSDAALRLANDLRHLGEEPWLDRDSLLPGQHWPTAIAEAIRRAHFFIALMSPHSVEKRGFVQKELRIALAILDQTSPTQVFIIPVRLAECRPTHRALSELQWVDLFPDWNFCPSSPKTVRKYAGQACPAERLSGKRYADNWLENVLVSGSMNGVEQDPQNPL